MQNQDHLLTIDDVVIKVNNWRKNKKDRSELMPEDLKALIVRLTPMYSHHTICSVLKIGSATLYEFKRSCSHYTTKSQSCSSPIDKISHNFEPEINFIPVQISDLITSESSNSTNQESSALHNPTTTNAVLTSTCQIERPDGVKLIITTSDPSTIIRSFLCSN